MSSNEEPGSSKDKVENDKSVGAEAPEGAAKQDDGTDDNPAEKDSMDMFSLSEYLARSLGLREKPESRLVEISLAGIAKFLASEECKNVVTMAGAGISTSAGIPDFRSPGTGLYDNLASYNLPHPQAIFDISFFRENPKPFFVLAKALYPGSFKPTPAHYFIKLLSDKGKLLRHFTQNIDTLERVAGLDGDKIVEAHGTFYSNHCQECGLEFSLEWMKEQIFADVIPTCSEEGCLGVVKPDIVFFGETLPKRFAECVGQDFNKCDLLVIMGTSLQVQPFASLVNRVPFSTPRLYINLEKGSSSCNPISALLFGGGFQFDSEDNYRDVFKEATCDAGCQELADLLGWGDELKTLVASEHKRIDAAQAKQPPANTSQKKSKTS
ncbi:NAD-dependent protein deacetylase sirtuin-2 isoform X1 [Aplysia californica]|uniref:NAD-dependent protein deacetylase n=1 Tax=Aplysia californica TaxID=6500 RepID=A0ABM0JY76_APLCA|nr:NAD-dependent protein deacetylase sirtuin-2 isoform X1 [Aplysia californica]XP_035827193.1 NAD-dependent protein deacetylase sirtuin-2 isoform X1 [Aplysia californica]